jgi:hypothetical protein
MTLKLNFELDAHRVKTDWIEYFNDFVRPTDYDTNDWTLTTVEAGAGAATEAIANTSGGLLVVTNDSADDDADFFQLARETFKFVAGKKLYFGMRFKLSDATQSDFVFGLQITDTTPLAVSDGLFFQKDDGDANLDFHAVKNATATDRTAIATLADDTFAVIEAYYDGANGIELFKDGVTVGSCALTNVVDDEDLTVSFGIQNGNAGAKVLTVDWIRVMQER